MRKVVTAVRRLLPVPEFVDPRMLAANRYRRSFVRYAKAVHADPVMMVDFDLPAGSVVLDVGAYVGRWSTRVLRAQDARGQPDVRILGFEPDPSGIAACDAEHRAEPRFELHRYGLGGRTRVEALTLSGPGSSVFGAVNPLGTTDVEIRDVADFDGLSPALVKVNIEGGEYELLDRMHETGLLARCGIMLVQFHDFVPNARRRRRGARSHLRQTHREVWGYPWVWERWDRK